MLPASSRPFIESGHVSTAPEAEREPSLYAAVVRTEDASEDEFALVTSRGSRSYPPLTGTLAQLARERLGGLPVVLVYRDRRGDLRTYGDSALTQVATKVALDRQAWRRIPAPSV